MKQFNQKKLIGLIIVGFSLFSLTYYSTNVLDGIRVFMLYNMIPMDLVFQDGINLKDYDASVIINCLHGGGCPEGIQYKNDETGKIEEREVVAKTAQPYKAPEDPNAPPDPRTIPDGVQQQVNKLDSLSLLMYGAIVIGLVVIMGIIIFLKNKKKQ